MSCQTHQRMLVDPYSTDVGEEQKTYLFKGAVKNLVTHAIRRKAPPESVLDQGETHMYVRRLVQFIRAFASARSLNRRRRKGQGCGAKGLVVTHAIRKAPPDHVQVHVD